jgi:hypothetical protein
MCIIIRKIGLGDDVQAIYRAKTAQNYTYEKLPQNRLFYNLFSLKKDNERILVGSNKLNQTAMFVYSESFEAGKINDIYVKYLEFFFKLGLKPMPEHFKSKFSVDDDFQLLNGAMDSAGDMVILGKSKDPKQEDRELWMAIVLSPSKLGYRVPDRTRYSPTSAGETSRSLDIWDMIGTAGTVAGLFSLF